MLGIQMMIFVFFFFGSMVNALPMEPTAAPTCTVCHPVVNGKTNIHLIPHSHDDVGWLKTYDQYYVGTAPYNTYENASVEKIITSSMQALTKNPDRRYIQVESAFFWKWWNNQNNATKDSVRSLLNKGQLEIINGGWSMNDEATSHYQSIIDQYTVGLRFLDENMGQCARPKVGWQIDPFGHSREHASINKQLGFEGMVVGRIDYRDKNKRQVDKNIDFLWTTSADLDNADLFTTMFPDFYISENGFNFDVTYKNYENITVSNLKRLVDVFADRMNRYRSYYKTSNILIPMGGDFTYQVAELYFGNLDRLIQGFANHSQYNVFYSTPSCYIKAVNDEIVAKHINLTKKTDDFFPYASDPHAYWTGYFTSRPTSKRYERFSNNMLQVSKQLNAFSKVRGKNHEDSIVLLKQAMGIMQHHDAVAGTEKQAVAEDYARLLTIGLREAEKPLGAIIGDLLKKDSKSNLDLNLQTCWLANISICDAARNDKFLVAVQNPLGWPVTHYVRIPVDGSNYIITGPNGKETFDVVDRISSFDYIKDYKVNQKVLIFAAKNIPALGVQVYYVEKSNQIQVEGVETLADDNSFGTATNGFTIDPKTGLLNSVTINGKTQQITQQFYFYEGVNSNNDRSSGAYVFRPINDARVLTNEPAQVKATRGKLVDEVTQVINNEITQVIRVYKGATDSYIEFDWLVGDLQFVENKGKEIVTRFIVKGMQTKGVFYTDSNGRELLKREVNNRADYVFTREEPVTGNYYPVTSRLVLRDESKQLEVAVLNDRAQGGTSMAEGTIELMIHRRLLHDDNFGVNEVLNERQFGKGLYARGSHYLTFGAIQTSSAAERALERKKLLAPWVLLTNAAVPNLDSLDKVQKLVNFEFAGLKKALPTNVHLLTLEPWRGDSILLRLEHLLEKNEDATLSKPVVVNLEELFTLFTVTKIQETTLAGNQLLEDFTKEPKLIWNGEKRAEAPVATNPASISLNPMQIRTFILTVKAL